MAKKSRLRQMPQSAISQQEANNLLAMEKERKENKTYYLPTNGEQLRVPIVSRDKAHKFVLDINSSQIVISKYTFQTRLNVVPLIRLDINGRPHVNPGDTRRLSRTHIHRYREEIGRAHV
jgi:hypothetical protein